jgi:hypothetical protein
MIIVIHDGLESSLAVFVLQRLHFNLINHFFNFVIVLQYKTREVTEFMGGRNRSRVSSLIFLVRLSLRGEGSFGNLEELCSDKVNQEILDHFHKFSFMLSLNKAFI